MGGGWYAVSARGTRGKTYLCRFEAIARHLGFLGLRRCCLNVTSCQDHLDALAYPAQRDGVIFLGVDVCSCSMTTGCCLGSSVSWFCRNARCPKRGFTVFCRQIRDCCCCIKPSALSHVRMTVVNKRFRPAAAYTCLRASSQRAGSPSSSGMLRED